MRSITSLRRSEVPAYLRSSEFYLSLEESDDEFLVPSECMKMDPCVNGLADLRSILLTMRFWILKTFPPEAMQYITVSRNASVVGLLHGFDTAFPRTRNLVRALNKSDINDACNLAAQFGRVDFLDHIVKQCGKLDIRTMMIAAENGRVHCLSYCYNYLSQYQPIDLNSCDWSALINKENFKCLAFIVNNGVSVTRFADLAVQLNSAKCLKYLHDHFDLDCWTPSTMAEAAGAGRLELVKQLHKHGCLWDESAPIAALQSGQGPCLKYLIEQRGIPSSTAFTNITPTFDCALVITQHQMKINALRLIEHDKRITRLEKLLAQTSPQIYRADQRNQKYTDSLESLQKMVRDMSNALDAKMQV